MKRIAHPFCLLVLSGLLLGMPTRPAGARIIAATALYGAPATDVVEVNPSGSLIAIQGARGARWAILVQDIGTGKKLQVMSSRDPILLGWVDDDTLIVAVSGQDPRSYLIDLDLEGGSLEFKKKRVRAQGWFHWQGLLATADDRMLWASYQDGKSFVYRLPTSELTHPTGRDRFPDQQFRVAETSGFAERWLSDRHGAVRAALVFEGESDPIVELRYRANPEESWRRLARWDDPDEASWPVGLTENGRDLLVLSREGRDTMALVEYRVDGSGLGRVVYANPDADVLGVVFDPHGARVLAAIYESNGLRRYHHLDDFALRQHEWLRARFPDQSVGVTSLTLDQDWLVVFVSGPRNPGSFYAVHTPERKVAEVGRVLPWLKAEELVDAKALAVEAPDGTQLEAFLALPAGSAEKRPPLVVMPHGGPIGVRSNRGFDPDVQYLVSAGYAVLTVNYRGSGGYGRAFMDAGRRQWGEGIEDDIDAAVDYVVEQGWVDPARMCIVGASYGGYSALVSVTRRPERYRCAASLNGPTDLLLMFESSDFAATEEGRREFASIVGDPETEEQHLVAISPAYRAQHIDVPVLLAHATHDRRVDIEHAHRMKAMLDAYGKSYEWMALEGSGHGLTREHRIEHARRLRRFLHSHLAPSP